MAVARPIPMPISPVEPDIAATPIAVRIDPATVLSPIIADRDIYWAVPPNPLVFRKSGDKSTPSTGAAFKRRLTMPDPVSVCAYYPTESKSGSLIPFGVSIDGNASAEETRRWPNERGQITVSVSGTGTLVAHMDDIAGIEVGDRICVGDSPHIEGLVGYPGLVVPQIVPFDAAREAKLREIEVDLGAATSEDDRERLAQEHKAANYFGVALELGYAEMRVLLTP